MTGRTWALALVMGTCACNSELAYIAYEIHAPDPPEPVYELAVMEASEPFPSRIGGTEDQPVLFPSSGSIGYSGDQYSGEPVQICAVGRGEEGRLLAAVSERVVLVPGETARVSMTLAALEDESEVEPQCQRALIDAGAPMAFTYGLVTGAPLM